VRARSIDRKELGGDAHRGLVVGGGALIKLGRRSSSSSGRRWTRGWGGGGGGQRGRSRPIRAEKGHREPGGDDK
jgi:hypothetical protein